ncbi:hypothetical protein B0T21DRAFT_111904 [Apiosordaria backusii]|uniref:Uncharacterized protein n=1 Tax=Apiosordaria backusii TaxID=314023 RepID=A0AA39ZS82_9PEZI|nr:hypothetical protein B0T21DRAFT_111904 [Apiosordaria backusii]
MEFSCMMPREPNQDLNGDLSLGNSPHDLACKRECYGLKVGREGVRGVIDSHGDAIYHLELPVRVVEPASLWQIRRENRHYSTLAYAVTFG